MKTYKHLFESMLDPEYVRVCINDASKGKRHRTRVRQIVDNPDPIIEEIITQLQNKTWRPPSHKKTRLQEGTHKKERLIEKPAFNNEQIVHHMLVGKLYPILMKKFYELSCGSVPGRGTHTILNRLCAWRDGYKGQVFYVAELDVKKFYQNIGTEILKDQLRSFIKDNNFLDVLFKVIDKSAPGLPLGHYTSPWLANLYLTPLDMYIIHTLKPDHYARYMDNLFLIDSNKEHLHSIVSNIQDYCKQELHVQIKENWQLYQFEHDGKGRSINCLGFVIHENRVTLRKSLLKRIRAKALRMHEKGHISLADAQAMISYSGWLQHSDTYQYYLDWIKPNVSFKYCKSLVRRNSKRSDKNDKLGTRSQQCSDTPSGD